MNKAQPAQSGRWVFLFLPFLAGVLLYLPALRFDFLNWDDTLYVTQNYLIRSFTWEHIARIFSTFLFANYHPVTIVAFAFEYRFFGLDPAGYHLVNILFHAANGMLIVLLLVRLRLSVWVAAAAGLFFVIHPLQVESVAWISSQKTVASAFFSLLTLIFYGRFLETKRKSDYVLSILFCVISILAKPTAMALPPVLFLIQYCFYADQRRKRLVSILPFVAIAITVAVLVLIAHRMEHALAPLSGGSMITHAITPVWALGTYIQKVFYPVDLSAAYPPLKNVRWDNLNYALPAAAALFAALAVLLLGRKRKEYFFAGAWFLLWLLPTLNVIPLASPIADRYMYLSILGPILVLCLFFSGVSDGLKFRPAKAALGAGAMALFFLLYSSSAACLLNWRDSETLWKSEIRKNPENARAYAKLGDFYFEKGKVSRAIALLSKGISMGLNNPVYFKNLVAMHIANKDNAKAREAALGFLRERPNDERLYMQLGGIEADSDPGKAEEYFSKAIELNPRNPYVWFEKGNFRLRTLNDPTTAYPLFLKAVGLDPEVPQFYIAIADCFSRTGLYDQAIRTLESALAMDPQNMTAWYNLSRLAEGVGNQELCRYATSKARKLDPGMRGIQANSLTEAA